MLRNTILPTCRRVCVPSTGTWLLLVAWGCWWSYVLVGGAIFQAIENSTREQSGAIALGQGKMQYIDAIYFTEVFTSSCGMGDIFPITDGGRGFVFAWSFVGTGLWGIIVGGLVIKLTNYIYQNILMSSYNDVKRRQLKKGQSRSEPKATQVDAGAEAAKAEKRLQPLEDRVLPWYTLVVLNLLGLFCWASAHLIFTGALYSIECCMGNGLPFTSNSFGNYFYGAFIGSQTICFGDYTPKTTEGRAWWLVWHQVVMMSNTLLFVTVTLALLKWIDEKSFWMLGRAVARIKRKAFGRSESADSDSEDHRVNSSDVEAN